MNIVDLILSEPEQANSAISASMQARVFDYLDNYRLAEEESIDEASKNFTKEDLDYMDQDALVENFDQLDELSKATLGSYIKKATDSNKVATSKFREIGAGKSTGDLYKDTDAKTALKTKYNRDTGTDKALDKLGASYRDKTAVNRAKNPSASADTTKRANAAVGRLTKEDLDEESKMSQQQWEDNRAHKATAAAKKDVAARDPETERRRKQMELLFPSTKTAGK